MEITSAAAGLVEGAVAPGGAGAAPATPEAPTADALARFESAMGGNPQGEPGSVAIAPVEGPGSTAQMAPTAEPASAGDAILRSLERMSHGFESTVQQAQQTLSSVQPGEMMSPADLMRTQFSLMQISVQQEITSKVVGKATQNLDSFLKNQ
jgi:type III secretion system YscI/HrpB-like protein